MVLRSTLAALLCVLVLAAPAGAAAPYRISLVGGAFRDGAWHTGVLIEMAEGWKTYWRMPGEAGIPPEFSWKTSVPAKAEVLYPAPRRYEDASGETVGYTREILLPVIVKAQTAKDFKLDLDLFFAVCKEICIPAKGHASIMLGASSEDPVRDLRVAQAQALVPVAGGVITRARLAEEGGKPFLDLALSDALEDIFVETTTSAYFAAPVFSQDGRKARLAIANLKDSAKLKGATLTFTYLRQGVGLEQKVTLP